VSAARHAAAVRATGPAGARDDQDPRLRRLLAATRRAAADGYEAVSMRALAAETRMSLATVYELVGSKDELIALAHAGGMEAMRDDLRRRPPRGPTVEARVRAVLRRIAGALDDDPVRTRALMRAIYSTDPKVAASRASVGASFHSMIDAAIGDARLPERHAVTEVLGHVVNSAILGWLNGTLTSVEVRRTLEDAARVVLGGR
jgi:AcrR family transcriptional regulator